MGIRMPSIIPRIKLDQYVLSIQNLTSLLRRNRNPAPIPAPPYRISDLDYLPAIGFGNFCLALYFFSPFHSPLGFFEMPETDTVQPLTARPNGSLAIFLTFFAGRLATSPVPLANIKFAQRFHLPADTTTLLDYHLFSCPSTFKI